MTTEPTSGADEESEREVDNEFINSLASDTLKLIQLDLVILTLIMSVMGIMVQEATQEIIFRVVISPYTIFGFQFLFGSFLTATYMYFRIRQIGAKDVYPDKGVLIDEKLLSYTVAAAVIGTAVGFMLLVFGAFDGLSEETLPITQIVYFLFPVFLILMIFNVLTIPELTAHFREKIGAWRRSRAD